MAAVRENAERQRVIFRNDPFAVERGDEGNLKSFDQGPQLVSGAAADRPEPDEREDALLSRHRIGEQTGGGGDRRRVGNDGSDIELYVAVVVDRHADMRQILGNVDVHGAGAALEGDIDRLFENVTGLRRILQEKRTFRGRREHRLRVGRATESRRLVQCALAPPFERCEARDREDRVGVGHRDREAREQIERAGSRSCEADAQAVGIDCVAAGHERGGLLVANDNRFDLRRMLER